MLLQDIVTLPAHAISTQGSSFGNEPTVEARWSRENLEYIRDLWSLNEQHYRQLVIMKERIADVDHWKNNPYELTRFITGPQGFDKAEGLFRDMVKWRIDQNIDTLLQDYTPPPILLKYLPSAILAGYDRDGDPIYLERGGAVDGPGLLSRFSRDELMRHMIWRRELASRGRWIEEYERKMGRPPTRLTIVYDLQHLSSRHLKAGVLPFLNESMKLTQHRYHGLAKRMIIIRAPPIFNIVWGICKYAFPTGAQKKMVFSGPNNHLQVLEKYIDLDVLPPCIVPDGRGEVAIDMPVFLEGGLIPAQEAAGDADHKQPAAAQSSGSESLTSIESVSDTESPATCSVSVRCKRILRGCWVPIESSTKTITVIC